MFDKYSKTSDKRAPKKSGAITAHDKKEKPH